MQEKINQSIQQIRGELLQIGAMLYDVNKEQDRLEQKATELKIALATLEHISGDNNNKKQTE